MIKYKVTLNSGSYEEFLAETEASTFYEANPGSILETIEIVEIQPDIEDVIIGYYQQANWQLFLDDIQIKGVADSLLKHSDPQVSSSAWTMYQIILGLMDWGIKQRTLVAEFRTFCFMVHTLSYALSPEHVEGLLFSLKDANINVLHISHLVDNLKTAGLLSNEYTY